MKEGLYRKIGYFCTFTPKELIHAAGFTPIRLLADNTPINRANAYIQNYCCSQVKGCLEKMLNGDLELDGAVFTRSCDSLMRLTDIWELNSNIPVYDLEFPTNIGDKSKGYFLNELLDFKKWLESLNGDEKITFDNLKDSIMLYYDLDKKLDRLYSLNPEYNLAIKALTSNPAIALDEIEKRLNHLNNQSMNEIEKNIDKKKAKILVTGSICPSTDIYEIIQDSGFSIVDDFCTGTRFFKSDAILPEINNMDDAMNFLIQKYFLKAPCPTKHYDNDRRFAYILEKAKDVDGVIFLLVKFCEPHFFDYPQLRKKIEEIGKKTLLLEFELPITSFDQIKLRINAFSEMF
ncbi:MAG TPA: 2-hydroxyacyl-CoA dehydratase [Halobacteria archaeon]|jgi:benzoyl-CoA reductase/2-hydroxyglutaryl-CoA dehydratase subunit BcrC/BadD/HgdB|nr:2-hydroxyacyl-CoA dehydratase [Halobacteria archaeon]